MTEKLDFTGPTIHPFITPPVVADNRDATVKALGYLRVMFAVDDIDEMPERLRKRGAKLVGDVVQYKDAYRLCYVRGLVCNKARRICLAEAEMWNVNNVLIEIYATRCRA